VGLVVVPAAAAVLTMPLWTVRGGWPIVLIILCIVPAGVLLALIIGDACFGITRGRPDDSATRAHLVTTLTFNLFGAVVVCALGTKATEDDLLQDEGRAFRPGADLAPTWQAIVVALLFLSTGPVADGINALAVHCRRRNITRAAARAGKAVAAAALSGENLAVA
jgi:hypothetical protein